MKTRLFAGLLLATALLACGGCNLVGRIACKIAGTTDMSPPAPRVDPGKFSELPAPPR